MHKVLSIFLLPAVFACALAAAAPRAVRVYEIDVRGAESPAALQDAMRRALVRATGSRDAGNDPALGRIVSDAPGFVQGTRPGPQGGTIVVFDGAAVDREIAAAGRAVWKRERPVVLVTLDPPPAGGVEAARKSLESTADSRGLPITLVPLPVTDASGADLDRPALLQAAQRFGGDIVLAGRGDSAALNGQWQWSLSTPYSTEAWTGSLEAGINGAADALSKAEGQSASSPALESLVQIEGVNTLADYAAAGRALEGIPGIERVALSEAAGTAITYSVTVRGGAEALERGLSASPALVRSGVAAARLVYQLRR